MKFGEKLKDARLKAELTQEAVAKEIGVSRQSLSNWENDRTYPDLASVLKLSDLYSLSLDDLLRRDMELRRRMEQNRKRWENLGGALHDFALLLVAGVIPLAWLEKTALGIALGVTGIVLICLVHLLFVFRLGSDWKIMALRCLSMLMWFVGYMLRILSDHTNPLGDVLWFGGHALHLFGAGYRRWDAEFPRHMTAFTGFVMALVIVFGTIPFVGDSFEKGEHIPGNPFNSRDYRVTQVLAGEEEPIPMVYLGSTTSVYLDYPGQEEQKLEGKFTYITQPEGADTKGVWEMLNGERLYRVTLEEEDRVTLSCQENRKMLWAYELEPAPTMGCTILDVLGLAGNGFPMEKDKRYLLVGGGIGVPPMYGCAQFTPGKATTILGGRSQDKIILLPEFEAECAKVMVATDDGSLGHHGFVDALVRQELEQDKNYDYVLACGPKPMLRTVARVAEEFGIPCQVSMEERMGCGIGACLVCACDMADGSRKHVCKDGPVFDSKEVDWNA